ncbi:hypothetical protein M0805_002073 [Coniferiporia weirii]|nr:hypothetical protein M0805_002073 [Coniferiporia weirii]
MIDLQIALRVSCITIFFYYCALNFHEEREYIWSRNWTIGKAMYLLARYSGAAFLIPVSASEIGSGGWNEEPNKELVVPPDSLKTQFSCFWGYLYNGLGAFIILPAEVILQMRVYALYGRKKKIFVLLVCISLFCLAIVIVQSLGLAGDIVSSICTTKQCDSYRFLININYYVPLYCSITSPPMSSIGWLTTSVVEFILFVMVIIKARQENNSRITLPSALDNGPEPQIRDTTAAMARDSAIYFAVIFTVCFIGTCLSFISGIQTDLQSDLIAFIFSLLNTYQTVVVAIMAILAPNLLIRLRKEYYGPTETQMGNTLTWNVADPIGGPGLDGARERTED